jgi:hypothetical protein
MFNGHQVPNLRGDGVANSQTDAGRIAFVDDVMQAFGLAAALGPVIAVGDLPGASGAQLNFVGRAYPNPALGAAKLNFTLAQPAKVTIRFYNVAGRLINEIKWDGKAGQNIVPWDGRTVAGTRAAAGVYFYRLSAPGIEFRNNNQRMVFLGQN